MAFLGVIVNLFKGVTTTINNKSIIEKLETESKRDLLDGLTDDEKSRARWTLKEVELEYAIINGKSREEQSRLEKEIISLMENELKEKTESLKSKQATQLDIAQVMIAMQKMNNDVKDYLERAKKDINSELKNSYKKVDSIKVEVTKKIETVDADINKLLTWSNETSSYINDLSKQIVEINKSIEVDKRDINSLKVEISALNERVNTNHTLNMQNQGLIQKYKKIGIALYIVTVIIAVGTSMYLFN